jgi:hypothetical protein
MQKIKQISKEEARAMGRKRRRAEEKNKAKRAANTNPYSPNFAQAEAMEDWVEAERAACLAHYLYLLDGEGMEDVRRLRDRAKKMRLAHEALWPEGKAPTLAMCARRFARPLEAFNVHLNAKAHSTPQAPKEAQS